MAGHDIDLPHTSSGETDWNTLGNILTAKILGEVLCASYVDRSYGQARKGFEPDTDWKFMYKEDGVVAFQKSFKDSPIKACMGRGVIDRPLEEIAQLLEDHERRKEWDRYLVSARQVKAMSEHDFILYMHVIANTCLVKFHGDMLFYSRMAYVGDKYVRTDLSIKLPEFPVKPPVVRVELHAGTGFVLEPYDGSRTRTLISFLGHVDLKIPPIVINRIMRRQPKAINRIRKVLMSPRRRAKSLGSYSPESSCGSFTASEARAMWAATTTHAPPRQNPQHYAEDMSIDEFIGRPGKRFQSTPPALLYHHDTDSYSKKPQGKRIGRSVSTDSAPKSAISSTWSGQSFNDRFGTPASFKSMDANGASKAPPCNSVQSNFAEEENTSDRFGTPASFHSVDTDEFIHQMSVSSPGGEQTVDVVELHVDSNPVIAERTGFHGDSQLPFYTPSTSVAGGIGMDFGGAMDLWSAQDNMNENGMTQDKEAQDTGDRDKEAQDREAQDKEAQDREAWDKEAEAQDKEAQDKEAQEAEAQDKEAQDREPQDKDVQDREPQDKDVQDREAHDKEAQDKEALDKEAQVREAQDKEAQVREAQDRKPQDKDVQDREAQDKEVQDEETRDEEVQDKETRHRKSRHQKGEIQNGNTEDGESQEDRESTWDGEFQDKGPDAARCNGVSKEDNATNSIEALALTPKQSPSNS